jgi:hypothetical protein
MLRLRCVACDARVDARLANCPACGVAPLAGEPEPAPWRRAAPYVALASVVGLGLVALDEPAIGDLSDGHVLAAIASVPGANCDAIAMREPVWHDVVETVTCAGGERYRIELAEDSRVRVLPHRE